jgi:hypothetical protein
MRKNVIILLGWLVAGLAHAGTDSGAHRLVESSMLVGGTVSIDATGAVTLYTLDQRSALPKPVARLLDTTVPPMHFKPVVRDGQPRAVVARMRAQVIAQEVVPDHFELRLGGMRFIEIGQPETDVPVIANRPAPIYPRAAEAVGASGTVYVAVRFDRSGHVLDQAVQQVNLSFDASDAELDRWRDIFARAALSFSRHVRFRPPTTGEHAADTQFTGIMPIIYTIDRNPAGYGQWETYIPGPTREIAWLHDEDRAANDSEAVPDGEFAMTGTGLRPSPGG